MCSLTEKQKATLKLMPGLMLLHGDELIWVPNRPGAGGEWMDGLIKCSVKIVINLKGTICLKRKNTACLSRCVFLYLALAQQIKRQ